MTDVREITIETPDQLDKDELTPDLIRLAAMIVTALDDGNANGSGWNGQGLADESSARQEAKMDHERTVARLVHVMEGDGPIDTAADTLMSSLARRILADPTLTVRFIGDDDELGEVEPYERVRDPRRRARMRVGTR